MANIDIEVAGRRYNVACRDGEEEHLRSVAAEVDRRAQDATRRSAASPKPASFCSRPC